MNFHIQSVETAIQAMKVQPDTGLSQAEADKPLPGTEEAFEDHLAVLLRIQIQAVLDAPVIPADEIRRFLEPFTWPRVFGRIERVYQNLSGGAPFL